MQLIFMDFTISLKSDQYRCLKIMLNPLSFKACLGKQMLAARKAAYVNDCKKRLPSLFDRLAKLCATGNEIGASRLRVSGAKAQRPSSLCLPRNSDRSI